VVSDPDGPAGRARARLRTRHADVLAAVDDCADRVAAGWDGGETGDRSAVADPLAACLRSRGVLDALPGVLADLVAAAGGSLAATPVAAPPYVVVTGEGVVLRATLSGGRLVVTLRAFDVGDGRYRRRDGVAPRVAFVPASGDR
jgi:hypothetical protein